jgi:hypothetical protein
MKYKIASLIVIIPAFICMATAQSPQTHLPGETKPATVKPLTPKSAMPSTHKKAVPLPKAPQNGGGQAIELNRLEHQTVKAPAAKSSATKPVKIASTQKSGGVGSGINAQYQKPHGKKN